MGTSLHTKHKWSMVTIISYILYTSYMHSHFGVSNIMQNIKREKAVKPIKLRAEDLKKKKEHED